LRSLSPAATVNEGRNSSSMEFHIYNTCLQVPHRAYR
jgi:hypothetical protein